MGVSENPLLPTAYDLVWSIGFALIAALAVVALISIARAAKRLSSTQALTWTLLVIFLPVLGPVAWLSIGRPAARHRGAALLR